MAETAIEIIDQNRNSVSEAPRNDPMTPMQMLEHAVSTGQGIDVIDKLMTLQERWEGNQARKAFDNAIADAKAEIPAIQKHRRVDFTGAKGRTNYAHEDMATIAETVGPILAKHGLSYRYRTAQGEGGMVTVTCIISHRDGYSEETSLSAGRDESGNKNNIQAVGSTITYLQRYTLKAALGLAASNDDDGASAERDNTKISQDQVKVLLSLIEDTGTDIEQFCKVGRIEAIPDMLASDFDDARRLLETKKQRMEPA